MTNYLFFLFCVITLSSCFIRVSIEDGCDRVSGVPNEEMNEVIKEIKANAYGEMDSQPPQEVKDTLDQKVQEDISK